MGSDHGVGVGSPCQRLNAPSPRQFDRPMAKAMGLSLRTSSARQNSLLDAHHASKHRDPNKPVVVELTDRSAAKIHGHAALDARA